MISYNEILTVIETFANGHKFEPRYYSEAREQLPNMATEDIVWPVLFVEPINGDTGNNTDITEVNIYCLDRLRKDRANYNDVVSDTKMILSQDLTRWLEEGQQDIEVDRSYPAEALNNYLLDYTAGWSMRVRIINERISICEVPFEGTEPDPEICEPATLTVNDDSFTTIPSGDSYDLTVKDTTGSEVGSKVGEEWIVPAASAAEGIKYFEPNDQELNSTTVSFADGDAAWRETNGVFKAPVPAMPAIYQSLDLDSADPYNTLKFDNAFGNKNRFTDINGGSTPPTEQAISGDTTKGFIDHLTGRYYFLWNGTSFRNWATTTAGFIPFGFLVPSRSEWWTLKSTVSTTINILGTTLQIGTFMPWTCSTDLSNTSNAMYVNSSSYPTSTNPKTNNTRTKIYVQIWDGVTS